MEREDKQEPAQQRRSMPIFGFNTDVKLGETIFHVQTEDRGPSNPMLDTTVYLKGRVLAKRSTSYGEFLASPDFSEPELHAKLEQQHKEMIEEVRAGTLAEMAQLEERLTPTPISVQLLNPATFLKQTTAGLIVTVTRREGGTPVAAAMVRVFLHTGAPNPYEFEVQTDEEGKAEVQFHMPRLGPAGAELVIQAASSEGEDEIKYIVRPRPKAAS